MSSRQVFVSGTWASSKAEPYREEAERLGTLIGESGFDLACGPGTGIARHVVDGYRSVVDRGSVRYYLPREEYMVAVGEEVEPGADEIIKTDYDYPMRNVYQVSQCCGLFVITGGDGALEEILPAVIDYAIPVAIVRKSGSAAKAMAALLKLYPEWNALVEIGDTVEVLYSKWITKVEDRSGGQRS